jgi:hypothetical protein
MDLETLKTELNELKMEGGISRNALFQKHKREEKYPGNNIHFLLGVTKKPILKDISSNVDTDGNFSKLPLLDNIRENIKKHEKSFEKNIILINNESFANRRIGN